ncbi:unnamed protein product [Effrenium voratum]|nr:unnamed protein product [Effrenium voratum]
MMQSMEEGRVPLAPAAQARREVSRLQACLGCLVALDVLLVWNSELARIATELL